MANDAVQQIKERLDIVDVISPYVELKPAGKSLKGKSPFSNEKTPSFHVSPDRGMYYCFSTSQGGDMFTFIEAMEGVDFKGALKILADKAGVELVPEDPKQRSARDQQHAALEAAAAFYEATYADTSAAQTYVARRGITDLTAKQWRIGYAPDSWRDGKMALENQKYTTNTLRAVGLIKGEDNKEPYDVFRDRVMFPINDASGRVVGFSGRILSTDSEAPKYVNSPETALFKKSEVLYGYDKAKHGIRQMDFSLIVEGQFDVVLAHQAGYSNTVAVSGTALTPHHVNLLSRLSRRCVLALDADTAGVNAVKRAAEVMLGRGIDVKVAELPAGEDPADIIADDPKRFKKIIGGAQHVIEFLLSVLTAQTSDERTLKLAVRETVLPYVVLIPNHIDRDHFIGVIAETLGTEKEAIRLEVVRLEETKPAAATKQSDVAPSAEPAVATTIDRKAKLAAYWIAAYPFIPPAYQTKIKTLYHTITGEDIADTTLIDQNELSRLTFQLETTLADLSPRQLEDELVSKLEQFRQLYLKDRLTTLKTELKAAPEAEQTTILAAIQTVQKQLIEEALTEDIFSE